MQIFITKTRLTTKNYSGIIVAYIELPGVCMSFRIWLQERWFQHKEEMEHWAQPVNYDLRYYFNRYRWWLKREYRYQKVMGFKD